MDSEYNGLSSFNALLIDKYKIYGGLVYMYMGPPIFITTFVWLCLLILSV